MKNKESEQMVEEREDEDFLIRAQESFRQMDQAVDAICYVLFPYAPWPQAIGQVEPIVQTRSYATDEKDECLDYRIQAKRFLDLNVLTLWQISQYHLHFEQSHLRFGNFYGGFGTDLVGNWEEVKRIGKMTFTDCTLSSTHIHLCTFEKLVFEKCIFEDGVSFDKCVFKEIIFKDCIFKEDFAIRECHLKGTIRFKCRFEQEADFSDCTFGENGDKNSRAYFNQSVFLKASLFARTRFCGEMTSFYKVVFEQVSNFTQAIFKTNLNLVNTDLDFDYDAVFSLIKEEKNQRTFLIEQIQQRANDFRDSFRIFKNTLSKEGNILDASNYHRVELYCKEIELNSKILKPFSKDWIDRWQLCFYRHISDHHTNLFQITSWIIVTIGVFGSLLLMCRYGLDFKEMIACHSDNAYLRFFDLNWITQSKAIGLIDWIGFWSLFWKPARIAFFSLVALSMCFVSYKTILGIEKFVSLEKVSANPLENLLIMLYGLMMIFLLFSFQKTARKNSIMPN